MSALDVITMAAKKHLGETGRLDSSNPPKGGSGVERRPSDVTPPPVGASGPIMEDAVAPGFKSVAKGCLGGPGMEPGIEVPASMMTRESVADLVGFINGLQQRIAELEAENERLKNDH